jgi:ribosome-associated translation inhibitor RaiA
MLKLGQRLTKPSTGVIRFEEDGRIRRVELEIQTPGRRLVAEGTGRYFGPALAAALAHLEAQLRRSGRLTMRRARRRVRT